MVAQAQAQRPHGDQQRRHRPRRASPRAGRRASPRSRSRSGRRTAAPAPRRRAAARRRSSRRSRACARGECRPAARRAAPRRRGPEDRVAHVADRDQRVGVGGLVLDVRAPQQDVPAPAADHGRHRVDRRPPRPASRAPRADVGIVGGSWRSAHHTNAAIVTIEIAAPSQPQRQPCSAAAGTRPRGRRRSGESSRVSGTADTGLPGDLQLCAPRHGEASHARRERARRARRTVVSSASG